MNRIFHLLAVILVNDQLNTKEHIYGVLYLKSWKLFHQHGCLNASWRIICKMYATT